MKNKKNPAQGLCLLLAALALGAGSSARAEDPADLAADAEGRMQATALGGRTLFASGLFSYTRADEDRGTDDGYGGAISFGRMFTHEFGLEANLLYTTLDGAAGGSATVTGGGVNALIFPAVRFPYLYGLVGLDFATVDDHPGTPASYDSALIDTGLGVLWPLAPQWLLRGDARFRMDAHGEKQLGTTPGQDRAFYDGVFHLGLTYAFGAQRPVAAEPRPQVVAVGGDSDNDGVPDERDRCPGSAAGAIVDADGCEADSDGDRVPDSADRCPDTPAGTAVDANGCLLDADGDGVLDTADECPHTPPGVRVLPNGCALDDCPPPQPGAAVDDRGCAVDRTFVLRGVHFEFDSDRLTEDARAILNEVAATLRATPDVEVELRGHTDGIGTEPYNQVLSERRAAAVRRYLTEQGIAEARMRTLGFGESQPIDSNDTAEGRERNRRVELKVLD